MRILNSACMVSAVKFCGKSSRNLVDNMARGRSVLHVELRLRHDGSVYFSATIVKYLLGFQHIPRVFQHNALCFLSQ